MHSWPRPHIPAIDGRSSIVRVVDQSTQSLVEAAPSDTAAMYVCGITPYDATHMGHAATYVAFDLLHRAWIDAGKQVHYVQNVTDVDTPLLERAAHRGTDWIDLARQQTDLFRSDMTALSVLPPHDYIGAVETIALVVDAVERMLGQGQAYVVEGSGHRDVYADLSKDAMFGTLAGLEHDVMAELFAERGGDPDRSGKRHPLDPLLWQAVRPGEPSWDGRSLGMGRPGWHVECAVIAQKYLGLPFDVQGGGRDLMFPHHEMSASHGRMATADTTFARRYVHAGFVGFEGEKMSKSRGNLVLVSELLARGVDPMAIRLAILDHHYRSDWEWTPEVLQRAQTRLERWRWAMSRQNGPDARGVKLGVRAAISHDLDAPAALHVVDQWVGHQLERGESPADDAAADFQLGAPGEVSRLVDAVLGIRI